MDWGEIKKGWCSKRDTFRILSIDGGGIRGIFPAEYLANVENEVATPIHEYFDLIVGTSTGGIIALAVSMGIPAKEIVRLYVEEGKRIFSSSLRLIPVRHIRMFIKSQYSNKHLQAQLKATFKEAKMKDANTMLCIPSIEHHKAMPKVFKTPHNGHLHIDQDLYMWQVALATSAAPFYFPPYSVEDNDCKLDGGLWANNPVIIGVAEAVRNGIRLEDIKVLSIGTGNNVYTAGRTAARINSLFSWRSNIIDLAMNAQSEGYRFTAEYLLGNNHKRINTNLSKKVGLSSTSQKSIGLLLHEAKTQFAQTFKNGPNIYQEFFL